MEIREIGKYNIQQRGKNYPCRKRNTFPSSKDKNSFSGRHQKIPCQHRGFPISERFGKKKYRNSVKNFYSAFTSVSTFSRGQPSLDSL
jgi:hypothetical protein